MFSFLVISHWLVYDFDSCVIPCMKLYLNFKSIYFTCVKTLLVINYNNILSLNQNICLKKKKISILFNYFVFKAF